MMDGATEDIELLERSDGKVIWSSSTLPPDQEIVVPSVPPPRGWGWIVVGCIVAIVVVTIPAVILLYGSYYVDGVIPPPDSFALWCVGNCHVNLATNTQPGIVLSGGGALPNVETAWKWQIQNANGGDMLVLVIEGQDEYNDYLWSLAQSIQSPLNSVTTISFLDRSSSYNQVILNNLWNAEAVLIANGSVYQQLEYWNNTPIQEVLQNKSMSITLGGIASGAMLLGSKIFSDPNISFPLTSSQAMANPFDPAIQIASAWLNIPILKNSLIDTDFVIDDRMGRSLTFQSRILQSDASVSPFLSIGLDTNTAIMMNMTTGRGSMAGSGTAYICSSIMAATVCSPNIPLTFINVSCSRYDSILNNSIDFLLFNVSGVPYTNSIIVGNFITPPYGPV